MREKKTILDKMCQGKRAFFTIGILLTLTFFLAATSVSRKSVTIDEYSQYPHGMVILKKGVFHIDEGATPLAKVVPAIPLLFTSASFDFSKVGEYKTDWQCGRQFAEENAHDYHRHFFWGRLVSICCLLFVCLLSYGYARDLYGAGSGLVALVFTCLSLNLLAHGRLITPDIYVTAGFMGSLWSLDRFLRRPGAITALILGTALGLTILFKYTGILLIPIFILLIAILMIKSLLKGSMNSQPYALNGRTWLWFFGCLFFCVIVINAGYFGHGFLTPIGDFSFKTRIFQSFGELLPSWLPVPFPYHFIMGMDTQWTDEGYVAYLLGMINDEAFWYYYIVGLLVKAPVPTLILCIMALIMIPRISDREIPLLLTPFLLFLFFSFAGHKNIGIRYILFVFPVTAVWISRLAGSTAKVRPSRDVLRHSLLYVGAFWLLIEALVAWPHYIPYFNVLSGGPSNGHKYLLDSNLDWGQDLIALKKYMDKNNIESVDLAYFGRVPPELYGIEYRHVYHGLQQRYVAISANFLWGRMYYMNATPFWPDDPHFFANFRSLKPKAVLGHTIYIYDKEH